MVASQICHFSGPKHASIPTNSVDVTDSVDEDVSTLTSGILHSAKKPTSNKHFLICGATGDGIFYVVVVLLFGALTFILESSFRC